MDPNAINMFSQLVADEHNRGKFIFGRISLNEVKTILFRGSTSRTVAEHNQKLEKLNEKFNIGDIKTIAIAVCEVMAAVCPSIVGS